MKSSPGKRVAFVLFALLVVSSSLLAVDIPLTNWTVPPYHRASASGGITTMTDITSGTGFVGVTPCRIVDTRGGGVFTGAYGPPALAANVTRTFDINSAPHCTGIPAAAEAYSLNFTVVSTTGGPGDLRAWPTGNPPVQTTSVLNWTTANVIIANATVIGAGTSGSIDVTAAGFGTQLLIDINGYFTENYNDGVAFEAIGNVASFFVPGFLVLGSNANTGIAAYGVWGLSAGVGTTSGNTAAGVAGWSTGTTGLTNGVLGVGSSNSIGAAGVLGIATDGSVSAALTASGGDRHAGPGVIGITTSGQGVVGIVSGGGTGEAVTGIATNGSGVKLTQGFLGYSSTTAVYGDGNIAKSGTVSFVEPHATDASKKVVYIALEGNEAGTYFRGRGKIQNGTAAIELPEDFRMVTQPEGLSIQVTPIGEMATVAVAQIGLDRIVVKGSRNVEFFYTVNGIRRGYGDFSSIEPNGKEYLPESPDARMSESWSPEIRSRLIANGTYKPDGSVNLETAQRLGWDRVWAERESQPRPAPMAHP